MKPCLLTVLLLASASVLSAQEREPPKDSKRLSVTGCVRGRSLIASARMSEEPMSGAVETGRRFRLSAPKKMLAEIRAERGRMVEVTGLVKISQLSPATTGIPLGKSGRIRIGGGPPNRDPTQVDPARDPLVNEPVMDVESWRPLPETCPVR